MMDCPKNDPTIKKRGWYNTCVEDLGADGPYYDPATCEWCLQEGLRYVHTMQHPEHPGLVFNVGCVCAGYMSEDAHGIQRYFGEGRESELAALAKRRVKWLQRKWRESASGNRYLNVEGHNVGVKPTNGGYTYWVKNGDYGTTWGSTYLTEDKAKLRLFDYLAENGMLGNAACPTPKAEKFSLAKAKAEIAEICENWLPSFRLTKKGSHFASIETILGTFTCTFYNRGVWKFIINYPDSTTSPPCQDGYEQLAEAQEVAREDFRGRWSSWRRRGLAERRRQSRRPT